jgi:uncharacterized protein (DUF2336 family)
MIAGLLRRLRPLSYERAKRLAADGESARRLKVASDARARPEILYYLASDANPAVRSAVAANPGTPVQADLLLAGDGEVDVRCGLARKVAAQAPGLDDVANDRKRRITREILDRLVADAVPRVRQIIAETIKSMPDAPAAVVRALAHDEEIAVAGPILESSPLLDDEELLAIVNAPRAAGAAVAVARRRGLSAVVADAIGNGDDVDAATVLLSNKSAQIREETLDRLIEAASEIPAWHRPLVERPTLTDAAAKKIARFVAAVLLQALARRHDLDPATTKEIEARVASRIDKANESDGMTEALATARRLADKSELEEASLIKAMNDVDRSFVRAALSILAKLPLASVDAIVETHSAKAITSLAWRAGLAMTTAARLQTFLGRIPPAQRLQPRPDGSYPLSTEAMEWHIEFFGGLREGEKGRAA